MMLAVGGLAQAAGTAAAGKPVYDRSCKMCHGPDGAPSAATEKMMKVEIKDLKSPAVHSMSDTEMKKIITGGKGKMRPIKGLSAKQLDDVVAYVRSLKK